MPGPTGPRLPIGGHSHKHGRAHSAGLRERHRDRGREEREREASEGSVRSSKGSRGRDNRPALSFSSYFTSWFLRVS